MIRALIFSLPLVMTAACDRLDETEIKLVGTVERARIELVAESQETITVIHVREGQRVASGDVILEQDPGLFQARLDQLEAAEERMASRLAELVRGPRAENIDAARAKLHGAGSDLSVQEREYDRIARLVKENLATESQLDRVLELREKAQANRDQAQAELNALLDGTTSEELAQTHASLREAEAAVRGQRILLDRLTVIATRNGVIDTLPYETGERPAPGATVAVLLAEGLPYARVYLPEPLLSRVSSGTRADIRVDGSDREFQGMVRYVSHEAAFTPFFALTQRDRSRLSFLTEIDFQEQEAVSLPSGLPLEVSFPSLSAREN